MRRREIPDKRNREAAKARFFSYFSPDALQSITAEQRCEIIDAITRIQWDNPRILDEIFMEMPYPGSAPRVWTNWERFKRRSAWTIRRFWLSMILQKSERRLRNRLSYYLFFFIMTIAALFLAFLVIFVLYEIKKLMGIDFIPGVHFFVVD